MPWWFSFHNIVTQDSVWTPITLQGAGLFHLSFGAILGVYAWTRGKESQEIIAKSIESQKDSET